jgi:aminoglycoside phosphotransferase (APT) family kinase protein
MMCYLEEAMEQQASTKVPRLGGSRLREIGVFIEDACGAMQELGIPETIIHNDINHGNILDCNDGCVFTDWCEAYVGNPFMTFQHLLLLLPPDGNQAKVGLIRLKEACKELWLNSLASWKIDQAFALMPLLAVTSYLYGRGAWLRSSRRYDPQMQRHARSLARHMDRAAQRISFVEALCQ